MRADCALCPPHPPPHPLTCTQLVQYTCWACWDACQRPVCSQPFTAARSSTPAPCSSAEGRRRIISECAKTLLGEDATPASPPPRRGSAAAALAAATATAAAAASAEDTPFVARPSCPPPFKVGQGRRPACEQAYLGNRSSRSIHLPLCSRQCLHPRPSYASVARVCPQFALRLQKLMSTCAPSCLLTPRTGGSRAEQSPHPFVLPALPRRSRRLWTWPPHCCPPRGAAAGTAPARRSSRPRCPPRL